MAASEFVEGEDIKMDEDADVGVLGTVATRFIIFFLQLFTLNFKFTKLALAFG